MAATGFALDHDVAAARAALNNAEPGDDLSFLTLDATGSFEGLPGYWIAAESGDWPAALADARTVDAWLGAHKAAQPVMGLMQSVWIHPLEALAEARSGDIAVAETLIATTPLDCYLCLRVRGRIAALALGLGRIGESQRSSAPCPAPDAAGLVRRRPTLPHPASLRPSAPATRP